MIQELIQNGHFHPLGWLLIIVGYLMPIPLAYIAINLWHHYRQERFIAGIKWVLLEIQVPREVTKSPVAMEIILANAFYHKSMKGFWEQYIQGAPWFWFSLEIASIDGRVHFFVRTPSRLRDLVEAQFYAQYPQAKLIEVDDYVFHVPKITKHGDWNMWGCEFAKLKEDFRPIKTWRDFGDEMKTGQKEEYKVDPLSSTIEYLGSIKKGQQIWIQIIIRQNIKMYHSHVTGKHIDFYEASKEFIEEYLRPYTRAQKNDDVPDFGKDVRAPEHVKPMIQAITRTSNQIHFDCGIRVVTLSNKTLCTFDEFMNLRRDARLLFRQFAQPSINELNRVNSTQFDAPWSDPTGLALNKIKRRMTDWYRLRIFFHPPIQYSFDYPKIFSFFLPSHRPNVFVMSVEELATIYHLPGMVSETPTFRRIESKIAKPPSNLPS